MGVHRLRWTGMRVSIVKMDRGYSVSTVKVDGNVGVHSRGGQGCGYP